MIEDYILIRKIKSGDTEAWERLIHKYYDQIYSYCIRRCMGNQTIAADLTQEVFLKVVENINKYRFSGKFFNYLFTITVNLCNNYYKKRRLTEYELYEADTKHCSNNLDTYLMAKENTNQIQKALNELPEIQREAIILKYYHDLKVKDIAKIAQISVPTAQSRIYQGVQKLNKLLNRKDFMNG